MCPWTAASSAASKARWLAINLCAVRACHLVCVFHVVLLLISQTPPAMLGKCPCIQGLAGLTAPVGVALLLVVFLGGADPASPPYRTQRVVFAWLVDVPVADPIRGQSSTDLSDRRSFLARYRPRGPCVYPAVPAARTCRWPARWLVTLSLRFAAMGEYYQKPASLCNLFHENKTIEQMIAIVKSNQP